MPRDARAKKAKVEIKKLRKSKKQNCETVKLWLQVVDLEGSTVSQFHSFTNRHGGGGSEFVWGGGSKAGNKGARERGARAEKRPPLGVGGRGWGAEGRGG